MNRILIPCDFSAQAHSAIKLAADIAGKSACELHMIYVIEVPMMHDSMLMPTLSFEEETMKELKENAVTQFAAIAQGLSSHPVVTEILYGSPSMAINDYIRDKKIDLVVMGTKGASGLKELLIGSTAEKIVRNAACPVITVRREVSFKDIRNIVFPNSLEEDQGQLVSQVKILQKMLKATLHIVWINTPSNFTADNITMIKLKDFVRRHELTNCTLNIYNDVEEKTGVWNFAKMKDADMIAMGTHGRRGIGHLLIGSIAEDIVNAVDLPIWTARMDD